VENELQAVVVTGRKQIRLPRNIFEPIRRNVAWLGERNDYKKVLRSGQGGFAFGCLIF